MEIRAQICSVQNEGHITASDQNNEGRTPPSDDKQIEKRGFTPHHVQEEMRARITREEGGRILLH